LQDVSRRVERAFQNFFRGIREGENIGYPRFAKFHRYNSFTYPQSGFSLHGNRLQVSKIGNIKIKLHRPLEGEIKQLTIVRKNDKYYACFCCEVDAPRRRFPITGKAVGIDVGITNYVATSDHELIPSIHAYRENLKQLKRLQRKLDKQKKGSKRRKKTAKAIARLHEKIANTRRDMAYKTANKLLSEYDIVVHEDLKIRNMVRNPNLALSIQDMGWGILFSTLSAMAQTSATKKVIKVDPRNTSQLCSRCNEMVKKELRERSHSCSTCGLEVDRDINASINILNRGLKLVA